MRILLVANTLPPLDISGAGEQVLQLAAGLRAAGHDVEVLGRGRVWSSAATDAPRTAGMSGPKLLFPLTVLPAAWRTLRRFRPEVVQVHESDAAFVALLVILLRPFLKPRPRLVALLQVSYLEEMRAVRPLTFEGRVLGRPGGVEKRFLWTKAPLQVVLGLLTAWLAELILAPSRRTADEIEADYRVRRVEVLPNVTGGLEVPAACGREDHEDGYLLYVGRLRIRKGVEVLLEALRLAGDNAGLRLLIAGTGEQEEALRRMVREARLEASVVFLGRCDAGRVRRLLQGARCLVVPSTYEGMPLVILEAMSEGVPVVASSVSGIPEVVLDSETGWLVPPEDPPGLLAALRQAVLDPDEAARRGAAGRERLAAEYTPAAAARLWLEAVSRRFGRIH